MLDLTDRHYRYFMRQITKHTELYTEMIVADAILHGDLDKLLGYDEVENPLIVQLGGSDPYKLAQSAKICANRGFSAINLNVGCPSDRVKSGNFGACLMQNPNLVADCIKAMLDVVDIPVTIKHRIGLDYNYNYQYLANFVATLIDAGCQKFIVHARNAVMSGLSPKQNREIPPLNYNYVYQLKHDFPHVTFSINGGINTIGEINQHLQFVDEVMLGRSAYYDPFLFSVVDQLFYNEANNGSILRKVIAIEMIDYLRQAQSKNIKLYKITKHMIGLYHGCANAKLWRHTLTNEMLKTNSIDTYLNLLDQMVN